ncbi:excinuclease ABC, C subunit domain protein [Clostridium botulinum A3 str. Loch Maree]|nr:excinuclease ABC, C subunit domain protein [Clostridium botulinum A3 str. Loch Maree]
MIDRVKYIASYQKAPVSAITHYAEVRKLKDMKIQISILYISRIKLLRYRI